MATQLRGLSAFIYDDQLNLLSLHEKLVSTIRQCCKYASSTSHRVKEEFVLLVLVILGCFGIGKVLCMETLAECDVGILRSMIECLRSVAHKYSDPCS